MPGRIPERSSTETILAVYVGSSLNQPPHNLGPPSRCSAVERRVATVALVVDVSTGLQQRLDHLQVPIVRRTCERRNVSVPRTVWVCSGGKQECNARNIAGIRSVKELILALGSLWPGRGSEQPHWLPLAPND